MTEKEKHHVFQRANKFLNSLSYETEMTSIIDSIQEHNLCYSIDWCEKKELSLPSSKRRLYVGAGRVLVSKINEKIEHAGSAPFVDWIHQFELGIQNLEEYWVLEILFLKKKIGSLKTLLELNTPELLKRVDDNAIISLQGEDYELQRVKELMDRAEIQCELKLKQREKSN